VLTEWEQWEVEAGSLEEACRKFHRLRYEDCECGEVVKSKIHDSTLVEVSDEAGKKYDLGVAEELIAKAEGNP
jgi:hypothetical protein